MKGEPGVQNILPLDDWANGTASYPDPHAESNGAWPATTILSRRQTTMQEQAGSSSPNVA